MISQLAKLKLAVKQIPDIEIGAEITSMQLCKYFCPQELLDGPKPRGENCRLRSQSENVPARLLQVIIKNAHKKTIKKLTQLITRGEESDAIPIRWMPLESILHNK